MNGPVELRLVRLHGGKIVRRWVSKVEPDDREALAAEFLTAVRLVASAASDDEARTLAPDYVLEHYARVGGWSRRYSPGRS